VDRRDFLKLFSAGTVATTATAAGLFAWHGREAPLCLVLEDMSISRSEMLASIQYMSTAAPDAKKLLQAFSIGRDESVVDNLPGVLQNYLPKVENLPGVLQNYLHKMENFENSHAEDVFLEQQKFPLLVSSFKRLDRLQTLVGHGNFNVVSFDEMRRFSKRYDIIGTFPKAELDFLEETFADNVSRYGFFGEKVVTDLTNVVSNKDRLKVHGTGHFLFRGESQSLYNRLRKDLGSNIVLTSGIRSIIKQTHLFLAKTIQTKGNLSRASRSLAPPGHSFHGIGDFDVGKVGFGAKNFTADFAGTPEFRKLVELGYVDMRYPRDNLLGVRYEPWHIKVV
jgi:hypothetical protein